jgi:hypothetical protein
MNTMSAIYARSPTMPDTPELTPASVAFLLTHKDYGAGCRLSSLTIREHLEKIEAEVRAAHIDALAAAVEGLPTPDLAGAAEFQAAVLAILGEPHDA